MTPNRDILSSVRDYVSDLLTNKLDPMYVYHNLEHTQSVVQAAREIGKGSNLSEQEQEQLEQREEMKKEEAGFVRSQVIHSEAF